MAGFQLIEEEIGPHKSGSRTASAALLAWFLNVAWRVEPEEVDDAICDGPGDKGIDGLLVDADLAEITIFQAKHRDNPDAHQGDSDLKRLVGAAVYFESPGAVDRLVRSRPNAELLRLLARLKIGERVGDGAHAARLVFVTNGILDASGKSYLETIAGRHPPLEVWDLEKLAAVAERIRRPDLLPSTVTLKAAAPPTVATLEDKVRIAVALVPAPQLLALPGIDDLSLFSRNVRLGEGRTRINRELGETIRNPAEHRLFPAYHNGLTLLTHEFELRGESIKLNGVAVVNGCQSLVTLRSNQNTLSEDLKVLVKVVQVQRDSTLADKITYRANNQNPVDIRDQRSTDAIQRDLQDQVRQRYSGRLAYAIKEGERFPEPEILDNKTAAQFIMAIYLKEPWNAVRKVRLFDEDYRRIFNRQINGHILFFVYYFGSVIESVRPRVRPELAASFASMRLTLAHLVAQVLRESGQGRKLLDAPEEWLPELLDPVRQALTALAEDVVDSVNFYVDSEEQEKGEQFDPKVVFKSQAGVRPLENEVLRASRRQAKRDKTYFFQVEPRATGA